MYRTSSNEEFVLWRPSVRTADGIDEVDEEWSRPELADFGALATDGSFSVGTEVFQEPTTIDQCLLDGNFRIRTTHGFDWDGCFSGVTVSRDRILPDEVDEEGKKRSPHDRLGKGFVEPAAWRSPNVLLDYLLGLWKGRGMPIDSQNWRDK